MNGLYQRALMTTAFEWKADMANKITICMCLSGGLRTEAAVNKCGGSERPHVTIMSASRRMSDHILICAFLRY